LVKDLSVLTNIIFTVNHVGDSVHIKHLRRHLVGRPKGKLSKPRSDIGAKRTSYVLKQDISGKTFKENAALKSFWSDYKMADIIQLSSEELDKLIDEWLTQFEARQMKRVKGWWYPTILYDPTPKKKKVNTSFNSSFVQKKVI
jgi:hypothetical protein